MFAKSLIQKFSSKFFVVLLIIVFNILLLFLYSTITIPHVLRNSRIITSSNCTAEKRRLNLRLRYPFLLNCQNKYNEWLPDKLDSNDYNYSKPSPKIYHKKRLIRGVVVHFPINKIDDYTSEIKWLYNSWTFMQKYEPPKWRTDLLIFIEYNDEVFKQTNFFLNELNCSFTNLRKKPIDEPMCTLINYKSILNRKFQEPITDFSNLKKLYEHFLYEFNIFSTNQTYLIPFYNFIIEKTNKYPNTDSVLVAFDGYEYFKSAGFDFLLRSDMDVFLTPLFGQWIPINCNSFYAGRGGYSTEFNTKRLGRIARELNFEYSSLTNIGSSWYSTPEQFRLAAFLSVFVMGHLAFEEFSQPEREGKLSTDLWPDWHYFVLSMYGGHLALNHLYTAKDINFVNLPNHIDFPSDNSESIFKMLHIHVFHGAEMFSKFLFKDGAYNEMNLTDKVPWEVNKYALHMALESKRKSNQDLLNKLKNVLILKN